MASRSGLKKEDSVSNHVQETPVPTQNESRQSPSLSTSWQLGKSLGASLLHLYEHSLWTDVRFKCIGHDEDDAEDRIRAHRAILAARSPVFQAMFYGPLADGKEEQELPTTEARIFNLVLRYVYSDMTDLTEDVTAKVMEMAHMYQIQGLVQYCANYLMTIVRVNNACEILELALFYETEGLRDAVCDVIDENPIEVLRSDKFLDISESCLTYILQGDTFYTKEKYIVAMVDRWAAKRLVGQPKIPKKKVGFHRRNTLGLAFHYLRVPTMTVKEFSDFFKGKGYYFLDEMEELIEYMVSGLRSYKCAGCHCAVERVPKYQTFVMGYKRLESTWKEHGTEVQCDLLLDVSKDCAIKSLKLYNLFRFFYSDWILSHKEITSNVCFVLRGKLTIHGVFEKEFAWIPSDTDEINLERLIPLPERVLPYTLTLSLVLERDRNISMSVDKNPMRGSGGCSNDSHDDDCKNKLRHIHHDTLRLVYCKESYAVNIIKSIEVRTSSNRKILQFQPVQMPDYTKSDN